MHEASREYFAPWLPAGLLDGDQAVRFAKELSRTADGLSSGKDLRLAAFLPDGRLVGLFTLNEVVRGIFQNAYAGWRVSAEFAGHGYGTEGVVALLDFAFAPEPAGMGLHRVQANIIPDNAPSVRVARKAGFRQEGLAPRYLKIAGEWRDHLMFAKTAEEHGSTG